MKVGYVRNRDDRNKACIIPGEKAHLIQWAFEQMATGLYAIDHLRMEAWRKGLKRKKSAFIELFRNPVYVGKVRVPAYKNEPAIIVKAQHEPLVSEKLFYDVQDLLDGRRKARNQPAHSSKREDLPLRGFLTCARCGKVLTGSGSKGNGGRYYYYHCRKVVKKDSGLQRKMQGFMGNLRLSKTTTSYFALLS